MDFTRILQIGNFQRSSDLSDEGETAERVNRWEQLEKLREYRIDQRSGRKESRAIAELLV
jgi:hypothetical protein